MSYLTEQLVVFLFNKEAGKWQSKLPEDQRKVFFTQVNTQLDYSKEEGYRYAELAIYGDMNYVKVYTRTHWVVAPLPAEDAEDDCDLDYTEGYSEWKLVADHDSGWRQGVIDFFNNKDVQSFSGSEPYQVIDLKAAREKGLPL